jgi:hypothetical protein
MRRIDHRPAREFATILMLTAAAGAASQVVRTVLEVGKSAGWWQ